MFDTLHAVGSETVIKIRKNAAPQNIKDQSTEEKKRENIKCKAIEYGQIIKAME
jgi:hypothetical protein